MTEIEELSSRITSALDRVAGGVQAAVDAGGEAENLRTALEQEKQVSAQLSDRVRALGERQEQALAAMEARGNVMRFDRVDQDAYEGTALMYRLVDRFGRYRAPLVVFEEVKIDGKFSVLIKKILH